MEFYDLLIIGAGMSAMAAAKSFRSTDSVSTILMVSNQPDLPSRKPPLSKQLWKGLSVSEIFYNPAKFKIDFWPSVDVTKVDFRKRIAHFGNGKKVNFGSILLATGLKPVELPGSQEKTIYFNTLADFRRLKRRAASGQSVVVVGGGLLSAELASAMRDVGLETTLVIPGQWPLNHYVPKQHGLQIFKRLREAGIEVIRQRRVKAVGEKMELDDGTELSADHFLPSIGQAPSLDFLDLEDDERRQGLSVDRYLRVQGVDGIYACGDIIRMSGYRESFCHEENALLSGAVAGKNLAGDKEPYAPSMFLYSEFFDMRLESIGFGRADELKLSAFEWLASESKGIALMSNQSRIQRITLINQSFRPDSIGKLTEGLIGKPMRQDPSDLMETILKKYVQ